MTYAQVIKIVLIVFGIILFLLFLNAALVAVLLFVASLILALALTPVVNWLERHRINRVIGSVGSILALIGLIALVGWLVLPRIAEEAKSLGENLPRYIDTVNQQLDNLLQASPVKISAEQVTQQIVPNLSGLLRRIGRYSISFFTGLFLLLVFFVTTAFILGSPKPILRFYLYSFPERLRTKAAEAWRRWAKLVVAWIWSNFVIGGIQATAVLIFLPLMDVPGAIIWATLALFGEFVARIGPIVMTVPPVLVAFAESPMTGVWVLVFYLVLQEVVEDVMAPYVRGQAMKIHPVLSIFATVALTYVFGLIGALIALPLTGLVKILLEVFYYDEQKENEKLIDAMLYGEKEKN